MRYANYLNPPRPNNNLCLPDMDGGWRICVQARHMDVDQVNGLLKGRYLQIRKGESDNFQPPNDRCRYTAVTLSPERFEKALKFASIVHDIEGMDEILVICKQDGSIEVEFIDR